MAWIVKNVKVNIHKAKTTIHVSQPEETERKREDIEGVHQREGYRWISDSIKKILKKVGYDHEDKPLFMEKNNESK